MNQRTTRKIGTLFSTSIAAMLGEASGSCPTIGFTIAKTRVVTHSSTAFDDGDCREVVDGRQVEVEGTLQTDGTVLATKVDLD